MKLHNLLSECQRLNALPIAHLQAGWSVSVGKFRFYYSTNQTSYYTVSVDVMHPDGSRFKIATETDDGRRVPESYVSGKWDAAYQEALDYISTANENARRKKDEEAKLLKLKFEVLF